jgi:hypothetical protein
MSLPKRLGVEGIAGGAGEKGGFYWLPVCAIYNYAGVNEMSGIIALPTAPAGVWSGARALIRSAGTYMLQSSYPAVDRPRFTPSKQYEQRGDLYGVYGADVTSQCEWEPQNSIEALAPPYNSLPVSVRRPVDFMGVPTGVLTWTFQVNVVGVIYIRGSFVRYTYT